MNALGKILGLIDGSVDLGAITGIFTRVADLVEEGRELAKEFAHDPRLAAYFAKVRGLLKLPSGETITKEQIAAIREHWGTLNDQRVHDTPPPPPSTSVYSKVWDFDPRNDIGAASLYKAGDKVWRYPDGKFRVEDGNSTIGGNRGDAVMIGTFSA